MRRYLIILVLSFFFCSCKDVIDEYIPKKTKERYTYYAYSDGDSFYMIKNNKDTLYMEVKRSDTTHIYYNMISIPSPNTRYEVLGINIINKTVDTSSFFTGIRLEGKREDLNVLDIPSRENGVTNSYDSLKVGTKYYKEVYEITAWHDNLEVFKVYTSKLDGILYIDTGVDEYVLLEE